MPIDRLDDRPLRGERALLAVEHLAEPRAFAVARAIIMRPPEVILLHGGGLALRWPEVDAVIHITPHGHIAD